MNYKLVLALFLGTTSAISSKGFANSLEADAAEEKAEAKVKHDF